MEPLTHVPLLRRGPDDIHLSTDILAVEEPLELRLDGHPISVLMRTPGADEELAAGFLLTEGIIRNPAEIRKIDVRPDENRILVFLDDSTEVDLGRLTRHFFAGSSCGLCGKATLDAVFNQSPPITRRPDVPDTVLLSAPAKLRAAQSLFDATGGLHAAGLFSLSGDLIIAREDIGRHNAVDKVVGRAFLDGIDMNRMVLLVSGRASFEILQKSLVARIPIVAAVSAPSSLAVDFARASGQMLIGFLRPPDFNRYA